jgi:hypothetical protein
MQKNPGSGKKLFRILDPWGQKGPDPGSGTQPTVHPGTGPDLKGIKDDLLIAGFNAVWRDGLLLSRGGYRYIGCVGRNNGNLLRVQPTTKSHKINKQRLPGGRCHISFPQFEKIMAVANAQSWVALKRRKRLE